MANYATIADLELYLGTTITGGSDEAKYEYLIDAVSKEIESICQRVLLAADYTEVLNGNGTNSIFLSQYPINTITSVEYGQPWDGYTRDAVTDYISYDDTGEISFLFESLDSPQMFEVVYNAGFSTVPLDLNLICVEEVVRAFNVSTKDTNVTEEKLGDYSYKLSSVVYSAENKENLRMKLAQYIKNDI